MGVAIDFVDIPPFIFDKLRLSYFARRNPILPECTGKMELCSGQSGIQINVILLLYTAVIKNRIKLTISFTRIYNSS